MSVTPDPVTAGAAARAQVRLRVVIAEDTVLLREGLRRVLTDASLDVAGTAGDADQLLQLVEALRPDVVLADIRMPPTQTTEGLQAALEIRRRWPGTAVIVLSQHVETEHLFELLATDPRGIGYVLKERVADIAQFTDAIRRVASGESVIDPEVVSRLVARPRRDSPLETLTEREQAVLALRPRAGPTRRSRPSCTCRPRPSRRTSGTCSPSSACCPRRRPPQGAGGPDLPAPVGTRLVALACLPARHPSITVVWNGEPGMHYHQHDLALMPDRGLRPGKIGHCCTVAPGTRSPHPCGGYGLAVRLLLTRGAGVPAGSTPTNSSPPSPAGSGSGWPRPGLVGDRGAAEAGRRQPCPAASAPGRQPSHCGRDLAQNSRIRTADASAVDMLSAAPIGGSGSGFHSVRMSGGRRGSRRRRPCWRAGYRPGRSRWRRDRGGGAPPRWTCCC